MCKALKTHPNPDSPNSLYACHHPSYPITVVGRSTGIEAGKNHALFLVCTGLTDHLDAYVLWALNPTVIIPPVLVPDSSVRMNAARCIGVFRRRRCQEPRRGFGRYETASCLSLSSTPVQVHLSPSPQGKQHGWQSQRIRTEVA